jgi:phosphate-selective porin
MNLVRFCRAFLFALLTLIVGRLSYAAGSPQSPVDGTPPPPPNPEVIPAVPAVPVAPLLPPPPPPIVPATEERPPLAGWHGGLFYLRDENDDFRLYFQGRAQIDTYSYFGPGVDDSKLKATIFLRRIRPELSGEFLKNWQWMLAGDWGATGVDNANGKIQTSPTAFAAAQTPTYRAAPTDVYLNFRGDKIFNVQVGQFDAPFTMENRTSDKYLPFMERSLAIRTLGIPTNKEIGAMVWGETPDRLFFYSAGAFNGEGQNRPNVDLSADFMGRVFTHPFALGNSAIKDFQIGASARYGVRNTYWAYYDYPSMTTQGNYQFWRAGFGSTRIIPSGSQLGLAAEIRLPVDQFDLTSEFVYVKNGTREAPDGSQDKLTYRKGELEGYGYYVQAGWWFGKRDVNGLPGYENPSHVDFAKKDPPPAHAVQLLVKWEQLNTKYSGASRVGAIDPMSNIDGDIKVNAFSFGANYWASKHVRLTVNYVLNMFPDSAPTKATAAGGPVQNSSQRAIAPGNTLDVGVNDDARDNAHLLHELLARVAVAF